jgi:hypothetical protein
MRTEENMSDKRFPVLRYTGFTSEERALLETLTDVPWAFVEEHEQQALRNHSQTVKRLAERGGLSLWELWCVVHDCEWPEKWSARAFNTRSPFLPSVEEMIRLTRAMIEKWEAAHLLDVG